VTNQEIMAMVDVTKLLGVLKKARIKRAIERTYQRFLELPVPPVLVVLWFAGLVLCLYGSLLVRALTGG
jgi:hypothetical protein